MTNKTTENESGDKPAQKTGSVPKIPTLNIGFKRPSMFSGNQGFMPKGKPGVKFNQSTFHTQHKGGTSGGK